MTPKLNIKFYYTSIAIECIRSILLCIDRNWFSIFLSLSLTHSIACIHHYSMFEFIPLDCIAYKTENKLLRESGKKHTKSAKERERARKILSKWSGKDENKNITKMWEWVSRVEFIRRVCGEMNECETVWALVNVSVQSSLVFLRHYKLHLSLAHSLVLKCWLVGWLAGSLLLLLLLLPARALLLLLLLSVRGS